MSTKWLQSLCLLVVIAVAVAVVGGGTSAQPALPKATTKWEYKVIDGATLLELAPAGEGEAAERALNKLGGEGWELVSVVNTGNLRWVYLKRPR